MLLTSKLALVHQYQQCVTLKNAPKCMSCHKAIVMVTGRAHCFHDYIITYILCTSYFREIWTLGVSRITYDHLSTHIMLPASELLSFWACFGLLVPAMCNHTSCAQVHVLPKSHCGDNWDGKQIVIYIYIHIDIWISYHCLLSVYYFPEIFQTTKLKSHSHFSLHLYLLWFTTLQLPCRSSLVGLRLVLISL